ncbi:MAG TPA: N-acetyl sugar amidotransferase [Bacteroidales bacterium]|nr:N-acetyl sugar amidotransferase [Bacteroidales bacterium]HPS15946.1 N-acetyl sugar amidotransferase [Bacteroidales bacterium]
MKKVLILSYDFPPYVSVGGLRPYNWYKYFLEYNVYPIIVTRQWENKYGNFLDYISASETNQVSIEKTNFGIIIKTPYTPNLSNRLMLKYKESKYTFLRRLISAYFEFAQYIFLVGPKVQLYFAAKNYLKKNNVDLIIATGEPYILFRYASKLNKKFKIPWIADYRDPWSQDRNRSENQVARFWYIFFEKLYLRNTIAVSTVSLFFKKHISKLVPGKTFYILPNGYNQEAIDKVNLIPQSNKKLSIAFVGSIYKWHPLESFLGVCAEFIKENKNARFQINFYGINNETEVENLINTKFKELNSIVKIFPKIPNEELVKRLAEENVFLLFNYFSYMGTKIYDYLALKRKILLCYSDDEEGNILKEKFYNLPAIGNANEHVQEDLIRDTNSGIIIKDKYHLKKVLSELYSEFELKGFVECNSVGIEQFSRKIQVQKFAEIINNILSEKKTVYQQCTRCVMDTSDLDITFDENGYCNHCTDYFEKTAKLIYQGKSSDLKLEKLVKDIHKTGEKNKYDCVIGISGGVDSIYTAYLAKNLGLRPLAVHFDNGWNSELAVYNIEKTLKKLDIDLNTIVVDWEEFRDLQLAFLKASVPEAETPTDIAILAALHEVADKNKIKYIFSGGNFATEGILPKSWHYNAKDIKYIKAIQKRFGTVKLKKIPTFGFQKEMYYKIIKGIKIIYPLNYVPYNKSEAIKILENELNWQNYGGKHHESLYTKFVQSYILPEKFGIDYRLATFSTQICSGHITRDYALNELKESPYNSQIVEEEKKYICKKFSISLEEFDDIMKLKPKSYKDYPNDKRKLEFIYKVYRKVNK